MYGDQDNKFFGLIEVDLYLGKPFQIVKFLSENPNSVQIGYESLATGAKMAYFFFSKRTCPATHLIYSLTDNMCWDIGCPDGQALIPASNIC